MRTIPKALLAVGAVFVLAPALAACDADENVATTPAITDVNPADWVNPMYPGHYTWAYATADGNRICTAFPARSGYPAGISCSANFPADAPEVKNDVFVGPPNTVLLTEDGVTISIDEGGPFTPALMPENHRITVGELQCTTLPEHGIQCASSTAGFTADNGTVSQTGESIAPSTAPTSAN